MVLVRLEIGGFAGSRLTGDFELDMILCKANLKNLLL